MEMFLYVNFIYEKKILKKKLKVSKNTKQHNGFQHRWFFLNRIPNQYIRMIFEGSCKSED